MLEDIYLTPLISLYQLLLIFSSENLIYQQKKIAQEC